MEVRVLVKTSFWSFELVGLEYTKLAKQMEKFVKEHPPGDEDTTEGFLNFQVFSEDKEYLYFEYFRAFIKEKADPRGLGTYEVPIRELRPIAISKDPFILLLFTPYKKQRDIILTYIPIDPKNRRTFGISADFIEFINVPKPDNLAKKVFEDSIEPRGRKGRKGETHSHIIHETYPSPKDREKDLEKNEKNWVFRDFAEVAVSIEEAVINFRVYPNGKFTINTLGQEVKLLAPYIAEALQELKEAEKRYFNLISTVRSV